MDIDVQNMDNWTNEQRAALGEARTGNGSVSALTYFLGEGGMRTEDSMILSHGLRHLFREGAELPDKFLVVNALRAVFSMTDGNSSPFAQEARKWADVLAAQIKLNDELAF